MPRSLQSLGSNLRRLFGSRGRVVSLAPTGQPVGDVLLSYITRPFLVRESKQADAHTNVWECRAIAQTFLDLGFAVDVINYNDERFAPTKPYRFLIDIGCRMEQLAEQVGPECTKIMHATGKHWLFQNRAELERLAGVAQRRGVALVPRRTAPAGAGLEAADCVTVLGNEGTLDTLRYAGKPLYPIPLSTTAEFSCDDSKDFSRCRNRFLWFGSSGMVHKGLDLVLEAFARSPELHLTVCGPVDREQDFERLYWRELYDTPNIRTAGWVDVGGEEFARIVHDCVALVYPSCSEGQAGCVVTSLHAGLIPIVSSESGVDVDEFGEVLSRSTVAEIRAITRDLSRREPAELRARSRAAWKFAREHHTRERFAAEFRAVVERLLAGENAGQLRVAA